jgi:hypothetical protein
MILLRCNDWYVTLLLTCITPRFVVQASDRRLTLPGGGVYEEIANKATMLCKHAVFAYTGLARCSVREKTDELLLRCLAQVQPINTVLAGLATEAARGIRNLPLPSLSADRRRVVRRTSFVGAGYLAVRTPGQRGRPSVADLRPFLAVVSNAQDLREEWRSEADQQFAVHIGYLDDRDRFLLHAAGQPFMDAGRITLTRSIRKALERTDHPQTVARLLARAIRTVAASNSYVGPNVMCTMVRRADVLSPAGMFHGAMIPLPGSGLQAEANYFRWPRGQQDSAQWIYSPGDPEALQHYGPNYTCNGLRVASVQFGPSPLPMLPRPNFVP